ncbi:MAG: putative lipid II flippase FtsW [Calditrichia bacterium]
MNNNHLDRWIFYVVLGLMAFGIIMVYSASAVYADKFRHDHLFYLKRQMLWVFIGIVLMMIFYKLPYEKFQRWGVLFVFLSVGLLIFLKITHSGRWIQLGFFHIQVSDIARLSLIFFFADSLSRKEQYLKSFWDGFFPHMIYLILLAGLIVIQPDFSSAAMLVLIGATVMFLSPIPKRYFFYMLAPMGLAAYLVIMGSAYKTDRVLAFLHPEKDMLGRGYQIIQSLISLGTGGVTGVGFAQSSQKLFFLPEAHTDFIFSIIGEEWGLIGTIFVLSLFFILLWRGVQLARRAPDKFSSYLAVGLTANLIFYALINMLVAVKFAPPTGLPLPFISYGGSFMLSSCVAVGLLLNISSKVNSEVRQSNYHFANRASRNLENRKLRYVR